MANTKIINHLKNILADTYALVIKTQNYHWNVTGPHFIDYHEFFGSQYEEMFEAIDLIAEHIRALDAPVEASFKFFDKKQSIGDGKHTAAASAMLKDLLKSHESILKNLYKGIDITDEFSDEATKDLFIERVRAHQKHAWMLKSHGK